MGASTTNETYLGSSFKNIKIYSLLEIFNSAGEIMNKKSIIMLISLIPVLIILISTFSTEIASLITNNKTEFSFNIPLVSNKQTYDALSDKNLQEYITWRLYVPNYDAEAIITPDAGSLTLNDNLRFKVKVMDKGILTLNKPSFYIFLVDPDEQIRGCFPTCEYENRKGYLDFWTMTSSPKSSNFRNYNLKKEILPVTINNSLFGFYREALIVGEGVYRFESGSTLYASKEIATYYYTYSVDKVGTWEIYVLIFGEEHSGRDGSILYPYDGRENHDIVNYAKNVVTVKGSEEIPINHESRWPLFFKISAYFIGAILTFFAVYVSLNKYYDKILMFIKETYKEKQYWIGLIIILLVFLIIQYVMMK